MPFSQSRSISLIARSTLLALATSVIFAAGCGIGTLSTATSPEPVQNLSGLHGTAMGGYVPIIGATATLYKTQPNGVASTGGVAPGNYTGTAVVLATATTIAPYGTFSFTSQSPSCSDPDQVYVTIQGGNSGGTQSNPNILLMAALGPCSSLTSSTFITVNEVTTVAAAYALAPFISASVTTAGNGAQTMVVNVTADANNYATGAAGSAGGTGTIYHPVGLQHAFLNAANLANYATGTANTTMPGGSSSIAMPAALINSVANVLQACTNSNGSTPEITFTSVPPGVSTPATLTSSALAGTSDTIGGNLTLTYAGGTATTVGPGLSTTEVTQAALASQINGISGLSAVWNSGVLTITGQNGTANTLVISRTDPQYTGTGVATTLLDSPATLNANNCDIIFNAAPQLGGSGTYQNQFILGAALNIATNPYMGGAGNAATFLGLSAGIGVNPFSPTITPSGAGTVAAVPHDLTAMISYPPPSTLYPVAATLDANDNVYLASQVALATGYQSTSFLGYSSVGTLLFNHAFCPTAVAGTEPTYNPTSCAEPFDQIENLAADALGNVWATNYGTTTTPATTAAYVATESGLVQLYGELGATPGTVAGTNTATQPSQMRGPTKENALGVDQNNDVWEGDGNYGETYADVVEFVYNASSTLGYPLNAYTSESANIEGPTVITFDADGNLWSNGEYSAAPGSNVAVLPNNTDPLAYTATAGALSPVPSYTENLSNPYASVTTGILGYGLAIDSSGNGYTDSAGTTPGIYPVAPVTTPGSTYAPVTSLTLGTEITGAAASTGNGLINTTFTTPRFMTQDGSGAIWVADNGGSQIVRVYGTAGTSVLGFTPCASATCPTTSASTNGIFLPDKVMVDSTGSIWVTNPGSFPSTAGNGDLVQIFGIGTPSYPLLQSGKPGIMP